MSWLPWFCVTNRKATIVNFLQNFPADILCIYKRESISLCYIVSFVLYYSLIYMSACVCAHATECWGMQALSPVWRSEDSTWKLVLWCYSVRYSDQTQVIKLVFKCLYWLSHYTAPTFICLWALYFQLAIQHSILWLITNHLFQSL